MSEKLRCKAIVYKRDTYRYTGRGKNGFEMHYSKVQCKRAATEAGFCWQHQNDAIECPWAEKHFSDAA